MVKMKVGKMGERMVGNLDYSMVEKKVEMKVGRMVVVKVAL